MKIISAFLMVCGVLSAQSPQLQTRLNSRSENAARMAAGSMPIYRVTVVARTTKAINYNHRSGSTKSISAERRSCLRRAARPRWRASKA